MPTKRYTRNQKLSYTKYDDSKSHRMLNNKFRFRHLATFTVFSPAMKILVTGRWCMFYELLYCPSFKACGETKCSCKKHY